VDCDSKLPFSIAQERWGNLKDVDGFLGQIGGWDVNDPFEAGILSFWKDSNSFRDLWNMHMMKFLRIVTKGIHIRRSLLVFSRKCLI
jgi:hypothetical protein